MEKSATKTIKPLGRKAYGSIGHLPSSRLGPGDHCVTIGQARICTEKARDKHDKIIVQQKYDGSCCAVAKIDGELHALGRAGYPAQSSKYEQHQLFAHWVRTREDDFHAVLKDGERLVGEWLAQAHGTRYNINCLFEPFIAFDIMRDDQRMNFSDFVERLVCGVDWPPEHGFNTPSVVNYGPTSIQEAMEKVCNPWAFDPIEGIVYRVERKGEVDFLAKFVRHDKVDGAYLPEISGRDPVWNWRPT